MVNTFVTRRCICSPTKIRPKSGTGLEIRGCKKCKNTEVDYESSANELDDRRLLKQCVEAYQIFSILMDIKTIAKLFGWGTITDVNSSTTIQTEIATFKANIDKLKEIRKKYLSQPYRLFKSDGNSYIKIDKNRLPFRLDTTTKFFEGGDMYLLLCSKKIPIRDIVVSSDDNVISRFITKHKIDVNLSRYKKRKFFLVKKEDVCTSNDILITLGFSQHAAVKMWVGYERSLLCYIKAHINVLRTRKNLDGTYKNVKLPLDKYETELNEKLSCKSGKNNSVHHPWWITHTDIVIMSHRASLLRKEHVRNEKLWYGNKDLFKMVGRWYNHGYVWPGDLSHEHLNSSPGPEICHPIQKYASPKGRTPKVTPKKR